MTVSSHVCLGSDSDKGIPCDECATELAWERYAEQEAMAQEREAS